MFQPPLPLLQGVRSARSQSDKNSLIISHNQFISGRGGVESEVWETTRGGPVRWKKGGKWGEDEGCGVCEASRMMMDYGGTVEWKNGSSQGCYEEGLEVCLLLVHMRQKIRRVDQARYAMMISIILLSSPTRPQLHRKLAVPASYNKIEDPLDFLLRTWRCASLFYKSFEWRSIHQMDYNFNMSMRRTRKKKILDEINNQEEAAKEKLFEISYLDEERLQDRSEILMLGRRQDSMCGDDDKASVKKGRKKVEKKKSNSSVNRDKLTLPLESCYEDVSSARVYKKSRAITQTEAKSIINTIESNKVFVGNTKNSSARTHTDVPSTFSIKKQTTREVMPFIKLKSLIKLQKIERSPSHIAQTRGYEHFPKDRWRLAQLFNNRNADRITYIQIKTKLNRQVLGNTEERLARKYEFFA